MRPANPILEKNLVARFLSRSFSERVLEFLKNPIYSLQKLGDCWYEGRHPDFPLLVPGAIDYLSQNISPDAVGFEWGSGRSTVWFASRCRQLISIEHSHDWFVLISEKLSNNAMDNVDYRYVELDHEESLPTLPTYPKLPRYVAQISEFQDGCFDFCLVDGHYRQACIQAALSKVKPGGLLIVDDSQWMPLEEWGVPGDWKIAARRHSFLKETSIWQAGPP